MRFVADAPDAVLAAAKDMLRRGLVEGTAGNISARQEDGTHRHHPVVGRLRGDGSSTTWWSSTSTATTLSAKEGRSPSSEKLLHLACYQAFDDIGSVIHSHPVYATMFAVAHQPIPACIDEFSIYVGGEVRVTEYAASGTPASATTRSRPSKDRGAALHRQPRHGGGRPPTPTRRCTSPPWSSAAPRSCGGPGSSGSRSTSCPTRSTATSPTSTGTCARTRCRSEPCRSTTSSATTTSPSSPSTGPRPGTRSTSTTSATWPTPGAGSGTSDDAWVAIVTGVGGNFMSGADLKTYIPQITELQKEIAAGEVDRDRRLPAARRHRRRAAQPDDLQADHRRRQRAVRGRRHGDARRRRHPHRHAPTPSSG